MNPNQENQPVNSTFAAIEPNERSVFSLRRHPIGILGIYTASGVLLVTIAVIVFVVAPRVFTSVSTSKIDGYGALILLVFAVLTLGFVFVSNKIYWGNTWVLTNDSITQTTQTSLFDKQSSQLSLGNLEDVTTEQNGILPHMFNYGMLRVETAGERSKFVFPYCPNPNKYAQQVLVQRQAFEDGRRPADSGNQGLNHLATPIASAPLQYAQPEQTAPQPDYAQQQQPAEYAQQPPVDPGVNVDTDNSNS